MLEKFTNPLLTVSMLLVATAAHARTQPAIVGETTMVIGQAKLFNSQGEARDLARGAQVREGDRIETGAGGHVHLKFVDGGRLSVRPASRLQIENYSQADQQSALTAIRFKLDEGTARSITGSWGEAERDRFRLNTPLAAIGVKGTDFSVSANSRQTLASVYSGAIVLTPMAQGCTATLGPCVNGSERLLSETMKGQMLAVTGAQVSPQLVAVGEPAASSQRQAANTATTPAQPVGDRVVASEKQMLSETRQVALPPSQLQWMRWPWTHHGSADSLSQAFDAALLRSMEIASTDGAFALMRHNPEGRPLGAAEPRADFRLAGATANLIRREGPSEALDPVAVNNGRLSVDFSRATYSTQLSVSSDRIGSQELASSGTVQAGGGMVGPAGSMSTRGSLSTDGREAGYSFSGSLPEGLVRGITLWGR